jgi:K+ transporter
VYVGKDATEDAPKRKRKLWERIVPVICILSASFVLGDGALTPAISVLSAVEGLEVFDPQVGSRSFSVKNSLQIS